MDMVTTKVETTTLLLGHMSQHRDRLPDRLRFQQIVLPLFRPRILRHGLLPVLHRSQPRCQLTTPPALLQRSAQRPSQRNSSERTVLRSLQPVTRPEFPLLNPLQNQLRHHRQNLAQSPVPNLVPHLRRSLVLSHRKCLLKIPRLPRNHPRALPLLTNPRKVRRLISTQLVSHHIHRSRNAFSFHLHFNLVILQCF